MATYTPLSELPEILTADELARYLRMGRSAVYDALRRGLIPSVKIGRRILIPRRAVEELVAQSLRNGLPHEGID